MQTTDIVVKVTPHYLAEQSDPERQQSVFAYRVNIENKSQQSIQISSRQWGITDGAATGQEVRGLGAVGQQPGIPPGHGCEYTSGCPPPAPVGSIEGSSHFV